MVTESHEPGPDSDSDTEPLSLFTDPPNYYPARPLPTTETHTLLTGQTLTLRLVGHNPLWGHHLWNGGRLISRYLEAHPLLVQHKTVLELGAGAGLPSLVCAVLDASKVVVTDYPDADLISNLWVNIDSCSLLPQNSAEEKRDGAEKKVVADGYCWGSDTAPLLAHLPSSSSDENENKGFDILILADLLFNHSEHGKLVATIKSTLKNGAEARALVFFTPYRPWLLEKDMAFFERVEEEGLVVEKLLEERMERVMFEEDPGDEEVRKTVFGFVVRWSV